MRGFGGRESYLLRSCIRLSPLRISVRHMETTTTTTTTSTTTSQLNTSILNKPGYFPRNADIFYNTMIYKYRKMEGRIFLEDLLYNEKLQSLLYQYRESGLVKQYILKDLVGIIVSERPFLKYITLLLQLQVFEFKPPYTKHQLCQKIITICIQEMDLDLASLFLLQFHKSGLINYSMVKLVITALCASKVDFVWNSYYLMQIIQQYPNLTSEEIGSILKYVTSNVHGYYFGNYMYNKMSVYELKQIKQSKLNEIVSQIVQLNLDNQDPESAFATWNKSAQLVQPERCINSLLNLLYSTENTTLILDVLNNLPQPVLDSGSMIDFQLQFYGTREQYRSKFNSLIPKLTHPLRRSTLTSFLKVFLYRNDERKTDKIIENIFNHEGGMKPQELDWIVNKLLNHNKQTEALAMIRKVNDVNVTGLSYVSIFRYLVTKYDLTKHGEVLQTAFQEICLKLLLTRDKIALDKFTFEIFNYLCTKVDIAFTIKSYMKVVKTKDTIRFDYLGMPLQFNQLLKLTQKNTIQILQVIAIESVKQQNQECLQWVIAEYRRYGWTFANIYKLLIKHDQYKFLEQEIKPEVINQCI